MDRILLLLGLLRTQEMHGYQLNEYIDRQMAFCVDLKRSTAYYLLDKLCREGYVSQETEREGNRPERRVFQITPAGEARFQVLLRTNLASFQPPTYAEDIGVMFQQHLPSDEVRALLQQRRAGVLARREEIEGLGAGLPVSHGSLIEHHLLHLDAELAWVDALIARHQQEIVED